MEMMDSLVSRVKNSTQLEVIRLEKRYAKRTHRDAYKGNMKYKDGEYVRTQGKENKVAGVGIRELGVGSEKRR
ncbi:hypothetical protein ABVK25_003431 [Lepraria finkii]|uniref:Uncharacterized protein n=1 Tax=Lepraria finkii TaxID=1340010 RepID=A0ABR4BKD7_9LECA